MSPLIIMVNSECSTLVEVQNNSYQDQKRLSKRQNAIVSKITLQFALLTIPILGETEFSDFSGLMKLKIQGERSIVSLKYSYSKLIWTILAVTKKTRVNMETQK